MSSPVGSPRKKRQPPNESSRRVSGSLTADGTANAAAVLGLTGTTSSRSTLASNSHSARTGMLPTPAKTPARKGDSAQKDVNIQAIARNLFAPEAEVMPKSRKKQAKKYVLDSFISDDAEESIQIYTDSHERIPVTDASRENPFWGNQPAVPEPAKRRSKRKQDTVIVPGEGERNVDEVVGREDGMVYVFRGRRRFYKRTDANEDEADEDDEVGGAEIEPRLRRPLTRSSIKPRLLFPPKKDQAPEVAEDDEEAVTDIEDRFLEEDAEANRPQTPMDLVEKHAATPRAPKFAPASPPTTARTTRAGIKSADETTPMKPARGSKRSPFDGWARTKNGSKDHGASKRQGESLESEAAKRTRA